jgi:hypothetical protein
LFVKETWSCASAVSAVSAAAGDSTHVSVSAFVARLARSIVAARSASTMREKRTPSRSTPCVLRSACNAAFS